MPTKVQSKMPPPSRSNKREFTQEHQEIYNRQLRIAKRSKHARRNDSNTASSNQSKQNSSSSSSTLTASPPGSIAHTHFHHQTTPSPTNEMSRNSFGDEDDSGSENDGNNSERCDDIRGNPDFTFNVGSTQREKELERENKALKIRISLMTKKVVGKSRGKNQTRRREDMKEADLLNINAINNFMRLKMHPLNKLKQKNWYKYSDNPRSLCQMLLRVTSPPSELTTQQFWEMEAAPAANDRWCTMASNYKEDMKRQLLGESHLKWLHDT
jgi:hypothetical protein